MEVAGGRQLTGADKIFDRFVRKFIRFGRFHTNERTNRTKNGQNGQTEKTDGPVSCLPPGKLVDPQNPKPAYDTGQNSLKSFQNSKSIWIFYEEVDLS